MKISIFQMLNAHHDHGIYTYNYHFGRKGGNFLGTKSNINIPHMISAPHFRSIEPTGGDSIRPDIDAATG